MSTAFKWDPKNSQEFTKDYGTQVITFTPTDQQAQPYPFDKLGGANFIMNAEGETLTLQNDSNKIPIYWPEFKRNNDGTMTDSGKGMQFIISSGTLEVSYQSEDRNNTVIYLGCAESTSFDFKDSGILNIINPGTVFFFIDYVISNELKPPKLTMSGNSKFKIIQKTKIQPKAPAFIFLASDISLHGSSELTFESNKIFLGDGNINYCNINIQDNSKVTLINDGIVPKNNIDKTKTKFNLRSGTPLLNLSSLTGINYPINLDNIEYPKGLFNFITTEGKNKGKIIIDISNPDSKETNLSDKIFSKELIAINGKIADKNSFNISYGIAIRQSKQVITTTISLRA
ncbi:hypothetical protein [Photorhabdus asymbiotica]|uniref:hypothetical protein n=1 Tax=Photorhabdus asymbiotica TaxID=291112 RepID=UPI003DA78B42